MPEVMLQNYKSRRNSARLVEREGVRFVVKTFREEETFQRELQIYESLRETQLPCARVLGIADKTLMLSELPGKTLVDCLEQQEETGQPQWDVWEKLVVWLVNLQRITGFVMTDVNLRNFLYDEETKTLYGLDFEECNRGSTAISAATAAAFIRTYKPAYTPLKLEISQYIIKMFAYILELEVDTLLLETERQEEIIKKRRNQ